MPEEAKNGQEPQTNEAAEAQPVEAPQPETFDRDYVEKLRRENAKYRTRAQELEEQRKAEEQKRLEQAPLEERLKALEAEREQLTQAAKEAEERRIQAERRAAFAGKVVDPDAAIKLIDPDKHLDADGNVLVDAFITDRPYMATPASGTQPTRGAGSGLDARRTQRAALEDAIKNARTRHERVALTERLQRLKE